MSLAQVRDRVARKVMNLPSAVHVYANGSTDPEVAPYPAETVDNAPHALVGRGATSIDGGTGNQRMAANVDVTWRFPATDRAEAERAMDRLEDEMITEFADGITLDGLAIDCHYGGSDRPAESTDEGERAWITWVTHVAVRLRYSVEMTP